ncbi:MAG: peptidoglycan DD-metalloendopeptidase family protein [Desulfuromusa sp.]|nr:peptidoglycan DD-metalloendopeptidase family protein [Desulfuromusa sp.]
MSLLLLVNPGWAEPLDQQVQLEKIRERIELTETNLQNKKKSELNISRELALLMKTLEQIDQRIGLHRVDLLKIRRETKQQKTVISNNQKNIKSVTKKLEKRLVALYKEGEVGPLKILFSADSPTEMAQQYHYLNRILQYDKGLLAEYSQKTEQQQQQLLVLKSLEQQQSELLQQVQQQRSVAGKGRNLQNRLLQQARIDKKKLTRELTHLKENAARLKTLLQKIEQTPPLPTGSVAENFIVGRGKLGWPVGGQVMIGFGKQKDAKLGTYYESNGIEIAVPPGSPIHAVAAGKIVYADYFKGYGNLFILNHPGGYHTLYAQTDRMAKKLGEQVSAGDLLGYSGLDGRNSIYFEIRAKGSPVDPLFWLKRR